eukprot:s1320_g2.t1
MDAIMLTGIMLIIHLISLCIRLFLGVEVRRLNEKVHQFFNKYEPDQEQKMMGEDGDKSDVSIEKRVSDEELRAEISLINRHEERSELRRRFSDELDQSQWSLPDFIWQLEIAVGTAGLHLRLPNRSGHCRTSSATARSQWSLRDFICDCLIAVGTAGLSAASARSQMGTAGLQPRLPDRSGHCRTFSRDCQQWSLPDFSRDC